MTLAIDLVCDLGHVFPRSNLEIAVSTKYLTWSQKKIKRGWIPWMVWYFIKISDPRFAFVTGVTFLSLTTSLWSYHYRNGDGAHSGHNTCWGAVLGFTQYIHRSFMRFAKFEVTRTNVRFELWSNLLHQLENIWNADRLVQGWTDGARCDYTIWQRAKMEHSGRIQYCISI